jgi:hypothetical protein
MTGGWISDYASRPSDDTTNDFMVGMTGAGAIVFPLPELLVGRIPPMKALRLAAWIVAMVDDGTDDHAAFRAVLEAVERSLAEGTAKPIHRPTPTTEETTWSDDWRDPVKVKMAAVSLDDDEWAEYHRLMLADARAANFAEAEHKFRVLAAQLSEVARRITALIGEPTP